MCSHLTIPPGSLRVRRDCFFLLLILSCINVSIGGQQGTFVTRNADTLMLAGAPFYAVGTNAYYLLEQAARGDSSTIRQLFSNSRALNFTVVRTWGFYDSPDSALPAVIQFRPGVFNERALRALDYVVYQAGRNNLRLLIPFVNNWNEYGGMNQYVRWRTQLPEAASSHSRYTQAEINTTVSGGGGREYEIAINALWGHDDFYSDPIIKGWYKTYVSTLINRMNTFTGVRYRDEPAILGWELANEPRSSDRSGILVNSWVSEMASYIKSIDPNHLVGTGEEGFDVSAAGYSFSSYNQQAWLFDGTAGVSFRANSSVSGIDFASCHVYPESWNLSASAGNSWIRDHVRIARLLGRPMILGEFAVREEKPATYSSWMTTALLDGSAGALVWQMLAGPRTDAQGYGFRCPDEAALCLRLHEAANRFAAKSSSGSPAPPESYSLLQNYPNPFNGVTTITYTLPIDSYILLEVFNTAGAKVATIAEGPQSAGERREIVGSEFLSSGVYFYSLTVNGSGRRFKATRKMVVLH